jgi:uncharacterized membrane protein
LVFGIGILILTPPFEVPDEPQHFFRAFQLSEGRFRDFVVLAPDEKDGMRSMRYGTLLPKSLSALVDSSDVANVRFKRYSKVQTSKLWTSLTTKLNANDREYLPVPDYPPAAYIPQVVGIWIGRLLRLSPLFLFYFARLTALCVWVALTFTAIRMTPVLKWGCFLLALMPMVLFLAGSTSSDSIILGVSLLLSATLFRWAYDSSKDRIGAWDLAGLFAMAFVIALSKAIYLSLLFLYFLAPPSKFSSKKMYYGGIAVVLALSAGVYFVWTQLPSSITPEAAPPASAAAPQPAQPVPAQPPSPAPPKAQLSRYGVDESPYVGISPEKQKEFILSHPARFARVLVNTLSISGSFYLNSFIGYLGWLDTPLPTWLIYTYATALIVACLLSSDRVNWTQRTLAGAVFGLTALASLTYLYLGWTNVGRASIEGLQGRHLIPVAPALLLLFSANSRPPVRNLVSIILIGLAILTNSIAAYALLERFYLPAIPSAIP